jgi:hypothetical protein
MPLEAASFEGDFMVKSMAVLSVALGMMSASASTDLDKYLTINSVQLEVETVTESGTFTSVLEEEVTTLNAQDLPGMPSVDGHPGQKANIGQIIQVANDVIALGERIYEIVKKGKPVVNTSYAPLSVLPKTAAGEPVDIMDTEGWSLPTSRKVTMNYKNLYGSSVVKFTYTVVFAHSGSYDGKGAYITAAQIIPSDVKVSWGFDFNASMRMVGLQNHGTRKDPVAGMVMSVNYKVESVLSTIDTHDTYHITGKGQLVQL